MGVCPADSPVTWPEPITHADSIGRSGYSTPNLIRRWVESWDLALTYGYDDYCMIEYDGVFLRQPPAHPGGLFTHLSGGGHGTFKASRFFHTPWWADRPTARALVVEGRRLISEGQFEHGSPDFFLGLICDRCPDIKVSETNTWSCNGGSLGHLREHAERSVAKENAWYLHGIRTPEELAWITSLV